MRRIAWWTALVSSVSLSAPVAFAQPASSARYFMPCVEASAGGSGASTTYRLAASFGDGVVAGRADSATYRILGGFNACSVTTVTNRVWASGVDPRFTPITGGSLHTIYGHRLDLGASTSVMVGGLATTVNTRANDRLTVTAPAFTRPGWAPITVTNAGGTAHLARALGVYPMADTVPSAIESTQPFSVSYRGQAGDVVLIVVTRRRLPAAVSIPPYRHAIEVDLATIIGDPVGPFTVTDPSGVLRLDFPGIGFTRPIHVQMIGVSATAPYAPGSLTNVVTL